ncbi:hypothetical protein evm_001364 [Chilo suppressalis]|nr:hypothetical protein evm_001364 [Chilo suppressalis]
MNTAAPEECSISGLMHIVLRVSNLVGVAPVRFSKVQGAWRIQALSSSVQSLVISYGVIILPSLSLTLYWQITPTSNEYGITTHFILWIVNFYIVFVASCVVRCTASKRMKNFIYCMCQMEKMESSLEKSIVCDNLSKTISSASLLSLVLICLITFVFDFYCRLVMNSKIKTIEIMFRLVNFFYIVVMFLALLQFITVVLKVYVGLQSVNLRLLKLLNRLRGENHIKGSIELCVKDLNKKYTIICDAIGRLNEANGGTAIAILLACCYMFIRAPYTVISDMITNVIEPYFALAMGFWFVLYCSWMLAIIEPCHRTEDEPTLVQKESSLGRLLQASGNDSGDWRSRLFVLAKTNV